MEYWPVIFMVDFYNARVKSGERIEIAMAKSG